MVFSFWSEMTDHVAAGYEGSNHNDYDRGQGCVLNAKLVSHAVRAEQRQDLLSRRHLDVGLTLMDPFPNDGKRHTFFQLLHWHRSLRKAKHRQCSWTKILYHNRVSG